MSKASSARRKVRQAEIAEYVGVSVSTVSRALNGVSGIRDAVREQVLRAASELGYENGGLGAARIGHVAFFTTLSTIGSPNDPFHTDILRGVEAECRRQGAKLTLITLDEEELEAHRFDLARLPQLQHDDVDSALLLSIDDRHLIEAVLSLGIQTIGINIDDPYLPIDTYIPNNRSGAFFACKYLTALGHRRIAHITNLKRATIRKRYEGYRAALADHDLPFDEELIIEAGLGAEASQEAMSRFLRRERDFSAVFCANDHAAIGVIHALRDAGREVPHDVSVVGFDDIPMAQFINPPLTTMRVQREEMGAATVRRLVERRALQSATPLRVQLATRLIERDTTSAPPTDS